MSTASTLSFKGSWIYLTWRGRLLKKNDKTRCSGFRKLLESFIKCIDRQTKIQDCLSLCSFRSQKKNSQTQFYINPENIFCTHFNSEHRLYSGDFESKPVRIWNFLSLWRYSHPLHPALRSKTDAIYTTYSFTNHMRLLYWHILSSAPH